MSTIPSTETGALPILRSAKDHIDRLMPNCIIIAAMALDNMARELVGLPRENRRGGEIAFKIYALRNPHWCSSASMSFGQPGFGVTRYAFNAAEKCNRLRSRRHDEGRMDEFLSSISADENLGTYGGGVVAFIDKNGDVEFYGGTSGYHPVADEALIFGVLNRFGFVMPPCNNVLIDEAVKLLANSVA